MQSDSEYAEMRRWQQEQTHLLADHDKRLAVVETEVHGLHNNIVEMKAEIKENTKASQAAAGEVRELRASITGGWWVLLLVQVIVAIAVGWMALTNGG